MFLMLHGKVGSVPTLSKTIISDLWTPSTLTRTAIKSPYCHNFLIVTKSNHSNLIPIGKLHAEKMAEVILRIYNSIPSVSLRQQNQTFKIQKLNNFFLVLKISFFNCGVNINRTGGWWGLGTIWILLQES